MKEHSIVLLVLSVVLLGCGSILVVLGVREQMLYNWIMALPAIGLIPSGFYFLYQFYQSLETEA